MNNNDLFNGINVSDDISILSHDLSVASGFCHRVLVFDKGKIIEENSGKNLLTHPQKDLTRKMVNACPRLRS